MIFVVECRTIPPCKNELGAQLLLLYKQCLNDCIYICPTCEANVIQRKVLNTACLLWLGAQRAEHASKKNHE
jgi:hypothetical protein